MPHPETAGPLSRLERGLARLETGLAAASVLLLLGLALAQILARELFSTGIPQAEPLLRMLVLYVLFLGAARASGSGRHLRLDILGRLLPPVWQPPLRRLLNALAALVSALLAWAGWHFWHSEWAYTPTAERWLFALALIIPLGFALTALHLALRAAGVAAART